MKRAAYRTFSFCLIALCLGACATTNLQPTSVKAYSGPDGMEVVVVHVTHPKGEPQAIIRVSGTMSKLEGRALPHRMDTSDPSRSRYVTTLDGQNFSTVHVQDDSRRSYVYTLYLPEKPMRGVSIQYDSERSQAVDAAVVLDAYATQLKDGSIDSLQAFDRAAEVARQTEQLEKERADAAEKCGYNVSVSAPWDEAADEKLQSTSVAGRCSGALNAMEYLCKYEQAREVFSKNVAHVDCAFGKEMGIELKGNTLHWVAAEEPINEAQYAQDYLEKTVKWPEAGTLAGLIAVEKSVLCTDGSNHYVGLVPHDQQAWQVVYGDGDQFYRVKLPPKMVAGDSFYDPREFAPTHNSNFRGIDYRYYSSVKADVEKGTCALHCGTREVDLKLLSLDDRESKMKALSWIDAPKRRKPYAIARDRAGTYYYVDVSDRPDAKDFRLLSGPKGNLNPLKMVNVVSDSSGDVFSTTSGTLRLVIEKNKSFWVEGGKSAELLNVPIEENLKLIYHELGVYTGQPFGTPCDHL